MDQLKVVVYPKQRLGVTEEEISVWQKIVVKVLDYTAFRSSIEIDQDVAAEDDVEAIHGSHTTVIQQIETLDGDACTNLGTDRKLPVFLDEILRADLGSKVAGSILAIDS